MRSDGIGRYFINNRTYARDADDKHQPVSKDGKNEVGDRACGNDGRTLTDGFIVERVMAYFRRHWLNAFVEHLHIAAEWDQRDNELGTLLIHTAPQRFTKTNGKTFNTHAAATSHPEMAELVHGDQYAKRNNKSGQIPENA